MTEQSPIQNRVGQLFIPVSDMDAAIAWYSRLFGLPARTASHEGRIYDLPIAGDCRLALDAHQPDFTPSSQTLCFFWTEDIAACERFLMPARSWSKARSRTSAASRSSPSATPTATVSWSASGTGDGPFPPSWVKGALPETRTGYAARF